MWIPAFVLAVPRQPKPLDPRYAVNFVDTKRLSSVTLKVLGGLSGSVLKRNATTAAVLFFPRGLGTLSMPCGPSPFACQAQERKYLLLIRIQALNPVGIGLEGMVITFFARPVNRDIASSTAKVWPGFQRDLDMF